MAIPKELKDPVMGATWMLLRAAPAEGLDPAAATAWEELRVHMLQGLFKKQGARKSLAEIRQLVSQCQVEEDEALADALVG